MIELPIQKYGLVFRFVEPNDSAFILSLRTDEKLAKHLSKTSIALEDQIAWINGYKEREKKGEEYYFIFETLSNERVGLIRLYDISGTNYNCGSWLIKPGIDDFAAIKSDLFINDFALNILNLEKCYFDVRKHNKKVLRYHKMFATQVGEDDENIYLLTDRSAFQRKKEYLFSILGENL